MSYDDRAISYDTRASTLKEELHLVIPILLSFTKSLKVYLSIFSFSVLFLFFTY